MSGYKGNYKMKDIKNMNANALVSIGAVIFSVSTTLIGGVVSYTKSVSEIKEMIAKDYIPRAEAVDMIRHDLQLSNEGVQKLSASFDEIQKRQQSIELQQTKMSTEISVKLDMLMDQQKVYKKADATDSQLLK